MTAELDDDTQDQINRRVYHGDGVTHQYAHSQTLNVAETIALLKYHDLFAGRDVLDIGVGTGRTTRYLNLLARRYVAIDYSPVMIDYMHRAMPDVASMLGDARDLSMFERGEFDFVFAPNNVIDALSHRDRLQCLQEIHRVLKPGGLLVFSSHNRELRPELRTPSVEWSRNPVDSVLRIRNWVRSMSNRARLESYQREEPDYALFCDAGHDYSCLHYYIDQRTQRRQLREQGFEVLEVIAPDGRFLLEGDGTVESHWLLYVASVPAH